MNDGRTPVSSAVPDSIEDGLPEHAIHLIQERYRRLIHQAPIGMALVGPGYRFIEVNPSFCAMLGYAADELSVRTLIEVMHPDDIPRLAHIPGRLSDPADPAPRRTEQRFIRKDGKLLWALCTEMIMDNHGASPSHHLLMVEDRTPFRLESQQRRQAQRSRTDIESEERMRISRELHDQTGQRLTAFRMALDQWDGSLSREAEQTQRMRLRELADELMHDLHRVMHGLQQTDPTSGGLDEALRRYVAGWEDQTGIATDYYSRDITPCVLSAEAEQTLFRVLQECLTNIHRHAGARRIGVTLVRDRHYLTLTVEDDGRGFDLAQVPKNQNGLGLAGMRDRLAALDGFLTVESSEAGTTVTVRLRVTS